MALSFEISCSLIINLLGNMEPLDFKHISRFIPFQIFFVFVLLIMLIVIIGFT